MSETIRLCKCGCGKPVTWNKCQRKWNDYIHCHRANKNYRLGKQWFLNGHNEIIVKEIEEKKKDPPLCECGCGSYVTWNDKRIRSQGKFKRWNRFISGHNRTQHTRETKKKISKSSADRHPSMEAKLNMSKAKLGNKNPMFGKGSERMGNKNPMFGHKITKEHKKRITESQSGNKHHNWQGGISRLPYSQDWTDMLKEAIRKRDRYQCQMCLVKQENLKGQLNVHHKDYNKKNCNPDNLIALCRSCHTKTSSGSRLGWIGYFEEAEKGGS